jgi:undecaprenyl-diphosphatase
LQAIVLGLTQGITEFAPVSSSGHLVLVPWLFGWQIVNDAALNKTFDVALHMGTLLGALVYFRLDVALYLRAWVASIRARAIRSADERLAWALVIGTIPAIVVGALFENLIEEKLSQPWLIAVMLAIFGVVLWAVDRWSAATRDLDDVGPKTGIQIGLAQALALAPGVSRSGITMATARALELDRPSSARFSFLLALPVIFGAGVVAASDIARHGFQGYASQFAWGFVASAISGFAVIAFLLGYLRRHTFFAFMVYRLAVAALALTLIATGVRSATV